MTTIIVDDSEIDRLNLRILLEKNEAIQIVGEAHDLATAKNLIEKTKPEFLFLDIHLGNDKGFSLLNYFDDLPQIILTTAHPQYALKGFEIDALDYILKPVTAEKLDRALSRIPEVTTTGDSAKLTNESPLFLKNTNEFQLHAVKDLTLIVADRPYTKIFTSDGTEYLHKRKIKEWKELLPASNFLPLDRSTIVNIHELAKMSEDDNGNYLLHFKNTAIDPLFLGPTAVKILQNCIHE